MLSKPRYIIVVLLYLWDVNSVINLPFFLERMLFNGNTILPFPIYLSLTLPFNPI